MCSGCFTLQLIIFLVNKYTDNVTNTLLDQWIIVFRQIRQLGLENRTELFDRFNAQLSPVVDAGCIIRTYLVYTFARGRHFDGEFPQEVLGAPRDSSVLGEVIARATCGTGGDALLVALLLRPLLVLREQLALLLEELRLAETLLEAGGALEGRRRARGRARELQLVPQQVLRAFVAYSRGVLVAKRPPLTLRHLAHRANANHRNGELLVDDKLRGARLVSWCKHSPSGPARNFDRVTR